MSFEVKHESRSDALRSGVFTVLTAALVCWPVVLIYKDSFSASSLVLVNRFVNAFPFPAFEDWCSRVSTSLLCVLSLILITLLILRNQL
jgi:hypothetical protein